jgi:hypothetical protein
MKVGAANLILLFVKQDMFEVRASSSEFTIDMENGAIRDVKAFEMGAALENGIEPFVGQAVACQLKKPKLRQALCNGKGNLIYPRFPSFGSFLL